MMPMEVCPKSSCGRIELAWIMKAGKIAFRSNDMTYPFDWDTVPESLKRDLVKQGIAGIAQALSVQKFSPEIGEKRPRDTKNIKKIGF